MTSTTSAFIKSSLDQGAEAGKDGWVPDAWRKPLMFGLGAVAAGSVCYVLIKNWPSASVGGDHLDALVGDVDVKTSAAAGGGGAPVAVVPPSKRLPDSIGSDGDKASPKQEAKSPPKKLTDKDLKAKGNECFKRGKYDEAIDYYSKAIEALKTTKSNVQRKDDLATYHQNRAAAYEKLNDMTNVVKDCTAAIENKRTYLKAYQRRAKAYDTDKQYENALTDLTTVCILETFGNQTTLGDADSVLKKLAEVKAKDIIEARGANFTVPLSSSFVDSYLMSFCEDPILEQLNTITIEKFRRKVSANIGSVAAATGMDLAFVHLKRKQYDKVVAACDQELAKPDVSPERRAEALALRVTFHIIHGNTSKANADFDAFFKHFDTLDDQTKATLQRLLINVHIKRGSFHMQLGNKDEAMADFALATRIDPDNADVYHHRAQLRMLIGEVDQARADFKKTTELRPDFDVARVQAGYAEYRFASQGSSTLDLNNSVLSFEKLVEEFPKCSEGFALLGQVYAEREAFDDAKQMFERALKVNPKGVNVYVHMGLLDVAKSEDYEKAKKTIQRAIDIDPHCEFAYETIGNLEVQRGQIAMAIEYFDRALNLARTELELIHIIGMREAACAQMRAAQNMGFELPGVASS